MVKAGTPKERRLKIQNLSDEIAKYERLVERLPSSCSEAQNINTWIEQLKAERETLKGA